MKCYDQFNKITTTKLDIPTTVVKVFPHFMFTDLTKSEKVLKIHVHCKR